jgi:ATP-dependent DNA helicase RecG
MVQTNDGFEISEVDLQLRGPGDLMGTQQSGVLDLKISNLSKDGQIVILAREMAKKMLSEDAKFEMPKNQLLKSQIQKILRSKPNWGRIA